MPIVILEMVVSATVADMNSKETNTDTTKPTPVTAAPIDKHVLIKECVDQVMELIEYKERR